MMKQAEKITTLPIFDPTDGMKSLITKEGRVNELFNQSSKSSILLSSDKKTLLHRLWDLQHNVYEKSNLFDLAYDSDLQSQIKNKMPQSPNKIRKATRSCLDGLLIYWILFLFYIHI